MHCPPPTQMGGLESDSSPCNRGPLRGSGWVERGGGLIRIRHCHLLVRRCENTAARAVHRARGVRSGLLQCRFAHIWRQACD